MTELILFIVTCANVMSIALNLSAFIRQRMVQKQQRKPSTPVDELINHARQQSEAIEKATELSNAYCAAIYTLTERMAKADMASTDEETELIKQVNMKQRNFLYHLRKLNPDYTIIKNH